MSWQGMNSGDIDVVIENWGHEDLAKKYIDQQGTVVDVGPNGNIGVIGWYVPPWLAKAHPEVLDYKNLNDFASDFATPESDGKGQLLDGDPSYVTNDEALVDNLGLNFKVVYAGSEAALHHSVPKGGRQQGMADRLLLRAAVLPFSGSVGQGRPTQVRPKVATPTQRQSPATTRSTS